MFISQYSPDVIARNVKQLGDGVIEVRRYNDGHVRADLSWVWFLCTIGFLVYDYLTSQTIINDMKWAISVDWGIEDTWNQHLSFSWYDKSPPPGYYDEFKARMVKKHWASFYRGWFYILFPLFWFFMVASPKWRPVRFDAKRRLVYFCSWGQLYIMHYPKSVQRDREQLLSFLRPEFFTPWIRPKHFGSLVFTLPHENPEKKRPRRIPLGIYRPACEEQNHALLTFILDYLGSENPDEEYGKFFKKEKRIASDYFNWFYQFSLFPPMGYNEKKTEARIQAWLDKH
ncbi:hypothetical protein BBH51_02230 [Aggregatibacter actinomycetemcomitans]|uniref:Uncharacterized protein n=2 Tax=Aggregatibacter actinomycetemcomitans TaxID=714 RepID=A0AAC8XZ32_AGGAC|nr:hypothetical protein [Aggregatibacter actinomycetemcomitans]AFI87043.1 hypothetical protein D7S_01270 [Aggregatibacter actinomycetemcomitans D7S-1]AMQ94154.1 hypothetical protein ACT75_06220 [Aggregatibacter actinomycetemcomitans]ANU81564.1 hypothetical protein BBH51_02230 [Aggregatibacter actinomycetemcomitans]KOE65727.1 hypothetical protein A160_0204455 [Aggregatibacter actinomycetemcomitans serotype e str. A160]KOE68494.1 hypothetical protein I63B_0300875 [Aggregatibacter actinomycetemco